MKRKLQLHGRRTGLAVSTLLLFGLMQTAVAEGRDILSDTWVAVDGLGRAVATHDEVGPPKDGKVVGIFYFAWLGQHTTSGPHNVQDILAADTEEPPWGPVGGLPSLGRIGVGVLPLGRSVCDS